MGVKTSEMGCFTFQIIICNHKTSFKKENPPFLHNLEVNKFNSFYFEGIIDDIPDGEDMVCDHLVFVIHGIGGACDIKFRPIHEVVDSYRDLTNNLSKKHFQRAHLMEQVSRYVTYQEF